MNYHIRYKCLLDVLSVKQKSPSPYEVYRNCTIVHSSCSGRILVTIMEKIFTGRDFLRIRPIHKITSLAGNFFCGCKEKFFGKNKFLGYC